MKLKMQDSGSVDVAEVLHLQRTAGNCRCQEGVSRVQT